MAGDWPNDDQVFPCPHCKTDRAAFTHVINTHWLHVSTEDNRRQPDEHQFNVKMCRTCGMPIVRHMANRHRTGDPSTTFHPKEAPRAFAPAEVKEKNPELAKDYKEAVECEPWSKQASVFLLGRCVERILIKEAGGDENETLGPNINAAIERKAIPGYIADPLQNAFLIARNQATHIWTNAKDEQMQVDEDTLNKCFLIVNALFQHFYVYPAHTGEFIEKMGKVKEDKQSK